MSKVLLITNSNKKGYQVKLVCGDKEKTFKGEGHVDYGIVKAIQRLKSKVSLTIQGEMSRGRRIKFARFCKYNVGHSVAFRS